MSLKKPLYFAESNQTHSETASGWHRLPPFYKFLVVVGICGFLVLALQIFVYVAFSTAWSQSEDCTDLCDQGYSIKQKQADDDWSDIPLKVYMFLTKLNNSTEADNSAEVKRERDNTAAAGELGQGVATQ